VVFIFEPAGKKVLRKLVRWKIEYFPNWSTKLLYIITLAKQIFFLTRLISARRRLRDYF